MKGIKITKNRAALLSISALLIISLILTSNEKGISYVRRNLDIHQAETVPYQNDITFTLTTKQILNGLNEPIHINQIYDTDIYVEEVKEKMNDLKEKKNI
ncbi:hypothetical protein [Pontibacillus yanchengensis]|uniref:Uncharacterized protein n=1 Tax=Pontibacillus yanchengensis TaxID=462910 RepID=A0A6I4ZW75_9BACI|nr:hypothetical protein [Pontibacillus yanchengensis]MYL31993.1 hypothetical protein [Pontibacillus yanchengensis]